MMLKIILNQKTILGVKESKLKIIFLLNTFFGEVI